MNPNPNAQPKKSWYVKSDVTIGGPNHTGGYIHPEVRIDPQNLDAQTEEKFINAVVSMIKEAFATARRQETIRQTLR